MNIAEKCDTIENENPNNRRNPLVANNVNVKKLEADLWESADLLRAGSKLTSNQYCMPVLGLIFLQCSSLIIAIFFFDWKKLFTNV